LRIAPPQVGHSVKVGSLMDWTMSCWAPQSLQE